VPYQLLKDAYEQGIVVEYLDFQSQLEAFYFNNPNCPPIIGISKHLFNNLPHFRTVFAHELGHHFTRSKNTLQHAYMHYRDRIEMSREEYRAMAWAAEYLISEDNINDAFIKGLNQPWDLSEYFAVDLDLVRLRLVLFFCKYRKK
jgi:Zn-dependent peptidase ImmA (M78 family)